MIYLFVGLSISQGLENVIIIILRSALAPIIELYRHEGPLRLNCPSNFAWTVSQLWLVN